MLPFCARPISLFANMAIPSLQMLQPMYTMSGFNWFDRRGTEGVGFIRALRILLTNNLPQILPDLSNIIRARFAEMHERHPVVNGQSLRARFLKKPLH